MVYRGAETKLALAAGLLLFPAAGEAHQKWFQDASPFPTTWDALLRPSALGAVATAIVLTGLAWFFWRARGGRDLIPGPSALGATEEGRAQFYSLVPLFLGVHIAFPLIVLGIQGALFSPNNRLYGASYYWLGLVQIGLSLCFLYGGFTRIAGAVLGLLWLGGIATVGLEPMLENLHYLGFAAFFFLAGRGPYSVDRMLFPVLEPSPRMASLAMVFLRIGLGLSLVMVAFTEKLANPALAHAFLEKYPLNFTADIGVPLSDDTFILCAGATELLIGLFLLLGIFPRVIIATAWTFINVTLTVFEWVELVGHLPIYGAFCILLVWTPSSDDRKLWRQGILGKT